MNKKLTGSLVLICLIPGNFTSLVSAQTLDSKQLLSVKDTPAFDENTYAKAVDQWMKANKPASANTLDLLAFIAKLNLQISSEGEKYGDKALIARQYTAYMLYDIAFVGDSVFSALVTDTTGTLKNMPAPATGSYPNTITQRADIPDNESHQTINSTSYYVDNGSDKTVVMHGGFRNSWSNGNDNSQTRLFFDRGYNLLIVDNRATGLSGGDYITFGAYESDDVLYWINQEITKKPNQKILLDGGSMGASTVLSVLNNDLPTNVKGLVEDCGFASTYAQLSDAYDTLVNTASQNDLIKGLIESLGLTAEFKQENLERVDRIYAKNWLNLDLHADLPLTGVQKSTIPKLFIHGTADSVVPYDNMTKLYANSSGYKQAFTVAGADHGQSLDTDPKGYNDTLTKFLAVVFDDKVSVNYLDDTNKQIAGIAPITLTGSYGDAYDVTTADFHMNIKDYTFKEIQGNTTGTFSEHPQVINYIYTKNPIKAPDITVTYKDQNGQTLHDNLTISGNISDNYDATTETYKLAIKGYTLDENQLPLNAKGTFNTSNQTISYIYTKDNVPPAPDTSDNQTTPLSPSSSDKPLPATGENQIKSDLAMVMGSLLITFLAIFQHLRRRKNTRQH